MRRRPRRHMLQRDGAEPSWREGKAKRRGVEESGRGRVTNPPHWEEGVASLRSAPQVLIPRITRPSADGRVTRDDKAPGQKARFLRLRSGQALPHAESPLRGEGGLPTRPTERHRSGKIATPVAALLRSRSRGHRALKRPLSLAMTDGGRRG
jgi:hypothetical protein